MFRVKIFSICLILSLLLGCQAPPDEQAAAEHGHEHGDLSVTQWTEKTELFMEYPGLVVGRQDTFVVHLSKMSDFKPVMQGKLECVFMSFDGSEYRVTVDSPDSPGVYKPVVNFENAGNYILELRLSGDEISDKHAVNNVIVSNNEDEVPHPPVDDSNEERIAFQKEQQWRLDFRVDPVQVREMSASIKAVGEILPQVNHHAEITALVDGIILGDQNPSLPEPGQRVRKQEIMAVISPHLNNLNNLNNIHSEFLLAKANYERAESMFGKKLISEKDYQEAKLTFEAQRAGYELLVQESGFGENDASNGSAILHFPVKSPINGVIQDVHFHIGETVEAGDPLFTVTNPNQVVLKANVPLAHVAELQNISDAAFSVEGYDEEFVVSQSGGRLLSVGSVIDEKSRTIPVLFVIKNRNNLLKIGMFAEASIKTGEALGTLAVSKSAVFDDEGTPTAYVQIGGELFAKRRLKTGLIDQGYVQVLEGIAVGERVVTLGGYQVKLASLTSSVPAGHGHPH